MDRITKYPEDVYNFVLAGYELGFSPTAIQGAVLSRFGVEMPYNTVFDQRPEVKEHRREYGREYKKEYARNPEVQERTIIREMLRLSFHTFSPMDRRLSRRYRNAYKMLLARR